MESGLRAHDGDGTHEIPARQELDSDLCVTRLQRVPRPHHHPERALPQSPRLRGAQRQLRSMGGRSGGVSTQIQRLGRPQRRHRSLAQTDGFEQNMALATMWSGQVRPGAGPPPSFRLPPGTPLLVPWDRSSPAHICRDQTSRGPWRLARGCVGVCPPRPAAPLIVRCSCCGLHARLRQTKTGAPRRNPAQ